MILVYSYDKASRILDLFSYNQVIALKVYLDTSLGEDNAKYVLDYKTYEDYPVEEHINIRSQFNEKNLQLISQTVAKLNEFITMMEIDNVKFFELTFDILNKEFKYASSYKKPVDLVTGTDDTEKTYSEFIDEFEKFITKNGIHKINIPDLFQKTSGTGKQRGVKYGSINFGQLVNKLKEVIIDNV